MPLQVCQDGQRPAEFYTAQLRDISRSGIYFQSDVQIEPGTGMELTFALPTEKDRQQSVLVRASAKALRVFALKGEINPIWGIAATIDRLDFVRPMAVSAA